MSPSPLAVVLVGAALAVYLAYSQSVVAAPSVARALRPLLGWPRRVALISAALLALIGLVQSPDTASTIGGIAVALGMRHAVRRQWAFGVRARLAPLDAAPADLPGDAAVVTLPTGESFPVAWVQHARLVRCGDVLLVGCALAGSVSAFRLPDSPVLVLFPLDVGFAIGATARWSGVTGEPLADGSALTPVDLVWGAAKDAADVRGEATHIAPRTVRIAGVEGADPTDVGVVSEGAWLPSPADPAATAPRRYLARWAARRCEHPGA